MNKWRNSGGNMKDTDRLEVMARELEQSGQYAVLRKINDFPEHEIPDDAELSLGAFVDVETTGLNTKKDQIIELGIATFYYNRGTGEIYKLGGKYSYFQDPGTPIPSLITELTGITDEMVRGQSIDVDEIQRIFDNVALIVAHNAAFDRPFLERLDDSFGSKPWACTVVDVPWRLEGIRGSKLEYIGVEFGYFFDAHRALEDCLAGVTILSRPLPKSGSLVMAKLLESARNSTFRFEATGAPFEKKDILRQQGYRWNREKRFWFKDVSTSQVAEENAWLEQNVFPNGAPEPREFTAFERYSERMG